MKLPPNENWKPIKGYEGLYEVSSLGRVRSLDRLNSRGHSIAGRVLSPGPCGPDLAYRMVRLSKGGVARACAVHRLVLETFRGPCPEGMEACHGNGNGADNRLENLRWDTSKRNKADKRAHGTVPVGERHHNAKLTELDVRRIFRLRGEGRTQRAIAAELGVSVSRVCVILKRREWRHVELDGASA